MDQTVKLWDLQGGADVRTFAGHTNRVTSVAFSPDGMRLASASVDRTIKLWDMETGAVLQTLNGHTESVTSLCFGADGRLLASGSADHTIRLWDSQVGAHQSTKSHSGAVFSVAVSPDGRRLASASADRTIKLWNAETGGELHTLIGHTDIVWNAFFSPDGQRLATCSSDRTIKLWLTKFGAAKLGSEWRTLTLPDNGVQDPIGPPTSGFTVTFSPDGKRLVSSNKSADVTLWDAKSEVLMETLKETSSATGVSFSADGLRLAVARSKTVKLWDAETVTLLRTLDGHTDLVSSVAFHPLGGQIASAGMDHTIRLWDVETGVELQVLKGHAGTVWSVCFSPDGRRLLSGSQDGTLRLWEVDTGAELFNTKCSGAVHSVSIFPDGLRIAAAAGNSIDLFDAREFSPDQKMGRFLAKQIAAAHADVDGALEEVKERTHWSDVMREAAIKYVKAALSN